MSASSKKKLRKELEAAQMTEKQLSERKEAKKLKVLSVTFIAVLSLILVVALGIAAFSLVSSSGIIPRTVDAVTIGNHTLTSAELNYFYVDAVNSAYNDWKESFGDYIDLGLAYNGLTVGKPLNQQQHPLNADQTWAEYFADLAVEDATSAYALYDAAVAAGHKLSEQSQSDIDMMGEIMSYYAAAGGYSSAEEYLKGTYGNGASIESYKNYMTVTALGTDYANTVYGALEYTADEIDAYNKEHTADFNSYSYSQFYVDRDDFLLCTDPNNTEHVHTAEEYAPALNSAKETADKLAASGVTTVEDLNAKIKEIEIYKDTNFKADTYTDQLMQTMKENVREEITDWLLDGTHKAGEMAVLPIPTEAGSEDLDGYLVILFHGMKENNENLVNVRHILFQFPTNATEDDKAATKKKADDLQTKWLAEGGTEYGHMETIARSRAAPRKPSSPWSRTTPKTPAPRKTAVCTRMCIPVRWSPLSTIGALMPTARPATTRSWRPSTAIT